MLVVDAGALFELLVHKPGGEYLRERLVREPDQGAPHILDVEVFGIIRRHWMDGRLDNTAAAFALSELRDWPARRFGHALFLARAWELRANVRGWDAMYIALAEALGATLMTVDQRLAHAPGVRCAIDVVPNG